MKIRDLKALIKLLEDPDDNVFMLVRKEFLKLGKDAIPVLEDVWESNYEPLVQDRVINIIRNIQVENIAFELKEWILHENDNLLKGVLIINKFHYPDIDEKKIIHKIEKISKDIWIEVNYHFTALENTKIINKIIFNHYGFTLNKINIYDPQNYFLNVVLETKKASSMLLSIIYIIAAQYAQVPVYGISLPENFLMAYLNLLEFKYPLPHYVSINDVLFYISVRNKGTLLSVNELNEYLKQINVTKREKFLLPCSNIEIIKLLLEHIHLSYKKTACIDKAEEIEKLISVFT